MVTNGTCPFILHLTSHLPTLRARSPPLLLLTAPSSSLLRFLMREAKRRNPAIKLYGLAWGFPGWVAEGGAHGPYTNSTAVYISKWVQGARDHHGLEIEYIGSWNEHPTTKEYVLNLRAHLDAANLTRTQIVVADDCCGRSWAVCDDLVDDAEFRNAVAAVGGHYPNNAITPSCAAIDAPKWASEDFSSDFRAGGCWARLLSRNYALANMTATIAWNLIAAYYDALPYGGDGLMHAPEPWSGFYEVGQVIWATAHHTQFTAPGWRYLGHGRGVGVLEGGGTYVSLTDGRGNLTIVVESITEALGGCVHEDAPRGDVVKQDVTFQLGAGFESIRSLNVFHSSFDPSSILYFQHETPLAVVNGSVTFTLLPGAVYTLSTVNGTKGAFAASPPSAPFPFPYRDDFDAVAVSGLPKYITDQSGSFEVVQSANATHGRVLRQMMPERPVPWCGEAPYTFSIIGDHSWRALRAEVDVLIERNGTAFIGAGVRSGGCVGNSGSVGLTFSISTAGQWLVTNSTALTHVHAQGKAAFSAGVWYHLGIEVGSAGTAAYLDGQRVAMVAELTDRAYEGWVAIGTSWDYVQFDNLAITQSTVDTGVQPHDQWPARAKRTTLETAETA